MVCIEVPNDWVGVVGLIVATAASIWTYLQERRLVDIRARLQNGTLVDSKTPEAPQNQNPQVALAVNDKPGTP